MEFLISCALLIRHSFKRWWPFVILWAADIIDVYERLVKSRIPEGAQGVVELVLEAGPFVIFGGIFWAIASAYHQLRMEKRSLEIDREVMDRLGEFLLQSIRLESRIEDGQESIKQIAIDVSNWIGEVSRYLWDTVGKDYGARFADRAGIRAIAKETSESSRKLPTQEHIHQLAAVRYGSELLKTFIIELRQQERTRKA